MVTVRAAREVILCAGSIGSPQILQLSGIGPAALLRQHGVRCTRTFPASARTCRTTCRSVRCSG
jgi:choline dehydrogenase